ncbi:MAG: NGG1p interacting factor NIF3 [Thiopseudomonas sp.]|nr:NGG1p interacting factor NIF3 [Thiopseudomonas sp.]MCK9465961.1 NGG1p interacting factor NIF3 [Thiopseudomonas sp.]
MYTLVFYIPETHLEKVKEAVFAAGAGVQGDYQRCCWQVLGQGQFEPMSGAQPFIGQANKLEQLPEWRVEMLVQEAALEAVIQAFKQAHPYEEPAYAVYAQVAP